MKKLKGMEDALQYGALEELKFDAMAQDAGYTRITTFYSDLSIAECYGWASVLDTFNRICKHWIDDYKFFTEFVLCLNWKIWEWWEEDKDVAKCYDELWRNAQELFDKKWSGDSEAMDWYFNVTD